MVGYRRQRHDEVATDIDNDNVADPVVSAIACERNNRPSPVGYNLRQARVRRSPLFQVILVSLSGN
jgi:hypothetical protein